MEEHMTINYTQIEGTITSHLSNVGLKSTDVADLFDIKEILIEDDKHANELDHVKKVIAISVGRLLANRVKQVLACFSNINIQSSN